MTLPVGQDGVPGTPRVVVARLGELESALGEEQALIEDLLQALLQQREGVVADNPQAIEATVHTISRTLLTLEEARRRRTALITLVIGSPGAALDDLERHLAIPLTAGFVEARERVRHAAERIAAEVAINQDLQSRAREAGDAFRQQLFSDAAP
jgi:hypothetical protein